MQAKNAQGPFPVPKKEIYGRVHRVQEAMRAAAVEALLLVQRVDLFYFTGTSQRGWLFLPAEGEPLFMVKKFAPRARAESPLKRIVENHSARQVPNCIQDTYGYLPSTLGLELDVIPAREFAFYRKLFPDAKWTDASSLILQTRAIKSAWEILRMEDTASRSARLFDTIPESIRPGLTELDYSGILEAEARRLGHSAALRVRDYQTEGYSWHILSGKSGGTVGLLDSPASGEGTSPAFPCGAGHRPLQPGEPIMIDFTFVHNGYHVDETRMFSIGPMPERVRRACEAAVTIHDKILETATPGVPTGHLYETGWRLAEKLGVSEQYLGPPGYKVSFVGHGIGLELVEPPLIARGRKNPLLPGMVFCLEPKLVYEGEFCAGVESVILVTEEGCRLLSRIPVKVFNC